MPRAADGSASKLAIIRRIMEETTTPGQQWHDFCALEEIPDGGVFTRLQRGEDFLLYRHGPQVTCMPNYCPHRGWAFGAGSVRNGVLTCPFHGYEFRLDTGHCLTSPDLPLDMYPVRIREGRVEVRLKTTLPAEAPPLPGESR